MCCNGSFILLDLPFQVETSFRFNSCLITLAWCHHCLTEQVVLDWCHHCLTEQVVLHWCRHCLTEIASLVSSLPDGSGVITASSTVRHLGVCTTECAQNAFQWSRLIYIPFSMSDMLVRKDTNARGAWVRPSCNGAQLLFMNKDEDEVTSEERAFSRDDVVGRRP